MKRHEAEGWCPGDSTIMNIGSAAQFTSSTVLFVVGIQRALRSLAMYTKPTLVTNARATTTGIVERHGHVRRLVAQDAPPLTTTFTPPPECLNNTIMTDYAGGWYVNLVWELAPGTSVGYTCYPSSIESVFFYSPGICPSGWTQLPDSPYTRNLYPLTDGEHAAYCCMR